MTVNRDRFMTITANMPTIIKRVGCLSLLVVFLASQARGAEQANPSEGKRLFRYYCAVCHGVTAKGDGVNSENLAPPPWDLTDPEHMARRTDQELFEIITGGGPARGLSVCMPVWGKTLSKNQIWNLISYIRSLTSGDSAPELIERFGPVESEHGGKVECPVCHVRNRKYRPIAPNLAYVGSKLNASWLLNFLKSPQRIRPVGYVPLTKSTMPNFQFSDKEAQAVADYLVTLRDKGVTLEVLTTLDLREREVQKGRTLFVNRYGCIACHRVNGKGGIAGPNLTQAALRLRPEWIFRWIQNPQAIEPETPMPNFGLPEDQIKSIVSYILSLGEKGTSTPLPSGSVTVDPSRAEVGKRIIQVKNCLFCHKMEPVNSAKRRQLR